MPHIHEPEIAGPSPETQEVLLVEQAQNPSELPPSLERDLLEVYDPKDSEIRGYIFDWDDTCQDTGKYWVQAHQEVMRRYGIEDTKMSDKEILSHFGNIRFALKFGIDNFRSDTDVDESGNPIGDDILADRIFDEVEGVVTEKLQEVRMDQRLVEAMQTLHAQGKRITVFSSSPTGLLNMSVALNGVGDLIDTVISKDDVDDDKHKPNPQGIELSIAAMNAALPEGAPAILPQNVLMIGDSWNDVKAGKLAGTRTLKLVHPLHADLQVGKISQQVDDIRKAGDVAAMRELVWLISPTETIETHHIIDVEQLTIFEGQHGNVSITNNQPDGGRIAQPTVNDEFIEYLLNPKRQQASVRNYYQELHGRFDKVTTPEQLRADAIHKPTYERVAKLQRSARLAELVITAYQNSRKDIESRKPNDETS